MFLTIDVIEVDVLVVDVIELDVLGVRRFIVIIIMLVQNSLNTNICRKKKNDTSNSSKRFFSNFERD
jgi:hypothetical protein